MIKATERDTGSNHNRGFPNTALAADALLPLDLPNRSSDAQLSYGIGRWQTSREPCRLPAVNSPECRSAASPGAATGPLTCHAAARGPGGCAPGPRRFKLPMPG
eukprot:747810-Hanusia_phi.AAC.7